VDGVGPGAHYSSAITLTVRIARLPWCLSDDTGHMLAVRSASKHWLAEVVVLTVMRRFRLGLDEPRSSIIE